MNDKVIIKINANDTKIPSSSGINTKMQYDSDKQDITKKLKDVDKNYPIIVGWSIKLITKQKLQRLKTR